ncbi:MAG: HAD hydrolase-like protein [Nanoarchaeota archaeon]|nr:HAD hydrolase-like protein [Nanoarchaeota archaeon]
MLLFDLNGVLVDTSQPSCAAIKKTAEFFLGRVLDDNIIDSAPGNGLDECYETCEKLILNNGGYSIRKHSIMKKFQEYYQGRNFNGHILDEKPLVDKKMLQSLKRYTLTIATERSEKDAEFSLQRAGLLPFFKHIVSYNNPDEEAPPASYLEKTIKKLKATKESTMFIGGHPYGLQVSQEAAIPYIAIINARQGKESRDALKVAGAHAALDSFKKIKDVL